MKPRIPRLKIKKRGRDRPLYVMCTPVDDIKEMRPTIIALTRLVVLNKLEGLSANQAGVNKQIFITDVPGDHIRIYINPIVTITDYDSQGPIEESCESYTAKQERYRHSHLIVDAQNLKGERFILDTSNPLYATGVGLRLAARIQHEMEHLFGLDVRQEPDPELGQMALADLLEAPPKKLPAEPPSARIELTQLAGLGIGTQIGRVRP